MSFQLLTEKLLQFGDTEVLKVTMPMVVDMLSPLTLAFAAELQPAQGEAP